MVNVRGFEHRGWRERVGDKRGPKYRKGLNLWHSKDLLAPNPSARQPLFETFDQMGSSLLGSLAKGFLRKVCGNSAESSRIFEKMRFSASGKGAEIVQESCGNVAEICGTFPAMTPSRTQEELRQTKPKKVRFENFPGSSPEFVPEPPPPF